jgi:transposase
MQRQKYSQEFKDQAVRRVIETSRPIVDVAAEINVHKGTLSNWVRLYHDVNPPEDRPLSQSERARLRELEKEVREFRMKTEFLGKAAALFAEEYR